MNADRKLISQPSVDSENNERVSIDRVGSFPFHALQPISHNIRVYTQRILHCTRIVCVTIVLIAFFTSISFFPLLFIYFIFDIDHFSIFICSFSFFNFWHRLFQANVEFSRFPVCVLSADERCKHREKWNGIFFYFYSFWWKVSVAKCSLEKLILRD